MAHTYLTDKLKTALNRIAPGAFKAKLGDRLSEMEGFGVLTHDYGTAHADKTYTLEDLPCTPIVYIHLKGGDAAANLILPPDSNKLFIVYNGSAQTMTVKADGESGVALTTGVKALVWGNGTDIVTHPDSIPDVTLTGVQTLTNKTLTAPVIATIENTGTLTLPTSTDTLVGRATTDTLTNKTLTAPVINAPDLTFGVVTHDYDGGDTAWTLSAAEEKAMILIATNAGGAVDAIATPTSGKVYIVVNSTGQTLTFKASGKTGVEIANGVTAIVRGDGEDFVLVVASASAGE
jgi:hypothetical protein